VYDEELHGFKETYGSVIKEGLRKITEGNEMVVTKTLRTVYQK
jgi:hypothetical protein